MGDNGETKEPFIQRLGLAVLGPFGLRFVPANHVQVINRLGAYQGARGPFFFWINTFTESLGPRVKVGARSRVFILDHLPTRDLLQLGLQIWLSFSFDPRRTSPEIARPLTQLTEDLLFAFVEGHLRHTLLAITGDYTAADICRGGAAFARIEGQLQAGLAPRLARLGIQVREVRVTQVTPPPLMTARFEQAAQRDYNIDSLPVYHPSQIAQALAVELVERLNAQKAEEQYVNIGDLLGSYIRNNAGALPSQPPSIAASQQPENNAIQPEQQDQPQPHKPRRGPSSRSRF